MQPLIYTLFLGILTSCSYKLEPSKDEIQNNDKAEANGEALMKKNEVHESKQEEDLSSVATNPSQDSGRPAHTFSYEEDIQEILDSNCTSCHSSGGTPPHLDSFERASTHANSSLEAILEKRMPPDGELYPDELETFAQWIVRGKLQYAETSPQQTELRFTPDIKPILAKSCLFSGCHNSASKVAGYEFETFEGTVIGIEDAISTIEQGEMPIGGLQPISENDLGILRKWLEAGTPQ